MSNLTRRAFLASSSALALPLVSAAAPAPMPGCQANAWNLDPAKFDLLLAALRDIKSLNFAGFETNIRFLQPQLPRLAEARAQLRESGLVFIAAHTGLPKTADDVAKLAGDARKFDAKSLVVSHGGLSPTGQFPESALDAKAKLLNEAGARAADAGLVLAYHNHQPEFRNDAAEETGLLLRTDPKRVRLMFDIGHAWLAYPDVVAFFEKHHDRVFGLHIRDFHNRESVPLGQGEFPLRDLAAAIRRTGWSGWLIDEEERPDLPDKPGTKATGPSRKTMREIFGV